MPAGKDGRCFTRINGSSTSRKIHPWKKVEENWAKLAGVEHATWVRTCYNKGKGVRYCVWLAPSAKVLEIIFAELDISHESIIEVEETVPDLWGKKWQEHLKAEATADTLGF